MNTTAAAIRQPFIALTLHGLHADAASTRHYEPHYSLHPEIFAGQLDWLVDHGVRTLTGDDLARSPPDDHPAVLLTFDDGDVSGFDVALPLLAERGLVADFYITTDWIGQPGMMDGPQLRAMVDAGMGVGAHGRSHRYLADLAESDLRSELVDSRAVLADIVGRSVDAMALPGGRGDARVRRLAAESGYRYLFTSRPGRNGPDRDPLDLARLSVYRGTDVSTFGALVHGRGPVYLRARARHVVLGGAKRLLGNRRYERLRGLVMPGADDRAA